MDKETTITREGEGGGSPVHRKGALYAAKDFESGGIKAGPFYREKKRIKGYVL